MIQVHVNKDRDVPGDNYNFAKTMGMVWVEEKIGPYTVWMAPRAFVYFNRHDRQTEIPVGILGNWQELHCPDYR